MGDIGKRVFVCTVRGVTPNDSGTGWRTELSAEDEDFRFSKLVFETTRRDAQIYGGLIGDGGALTITVEINQLQCRVEGCERRALPAGFRGEPGLCHQHQPSGEE